MTDFVHLNVHSDYSLSIASIPKLVAKAASLGMKRLALTDKCSMAGIPLFVKTCREAGIHPIIGSEFILTTGLGLNTAKRKAGTCRLFILASTPKGYRNLIKLISYSYKEGYNKEPRIDHETLTAYCEGLIGFSDCYSGKLTTEALEKTAIDLYDVLGMANFFLMLQNQNTPSQKKHNAALADISLRFGIPLVATNDIRYIDKEDAFAFDVRLRIDQSAAQAKKNRNRLGSNEFYFKNGDEISALFPECPEAVVNTRRIAERCAVEFPVLKPEPPEFVLPEGFSSSIEYLRHLVMKGIAKRYPDVNGAVMDRVNHELDIIDQTGYADYLLIVEDFMQWAKDHGIFAWVRCLAVSSLVSYALGITGIDPLRYHLFLERFITPEHPSPRFDIQFSSNDREQIMEYITVKYGKEQIGGTSVFSRFRAKDLIKSVGNVLNIGASELDRIISLFPDDPRITLEKAFEQESALRNMDQQAVYGELFAITRKLEGLNCSRYVFPGIIMGKTNLSDYVPLFSDPHTGEILSQYTMEESKEAGLFTFCLLSTYGKNSALNIIKNTEKLLKKQKRFREFSVDNIPLDDETTFALLADEGIAEIAWWFDNTGSARDILRQVRPSCLEDISALSVLYCSRLSELIPQFIDCRHGRRPVEYPHPCLEDILKETYGIIVYPEQILRIISHVAGYTVTRADILRGILYKGKDEVSDAERQTFITEAEKRGLTREDAVHIFNTLASCVGHVLSKSFYITQSLLMYQCAYLKTHFLKEYNKAFKKCKGYAE
jgi:DNA polymerase-3 subunit alpha